MRVTRARAEENRQRIIGAAAAWLAERGFQAVGVVDVMNAVGLTHGGFYGHFASKGDLIERACRRGFENGHSTWMGIVDQADDAPLNALPAYYVSPHHRDAPEEGCTLAALCLDASRSSAAIQAAFADGLRSYFAILTRIVGGGSKRDRRQRSLAALSEMVGAIVVARAIADSDQELSQEVLTAARSNLARVAMQGGSE